MTDFRLAPPPRRVPLSLRITLILNAAAQLGWFLIGFGSVMFWQLVMHADYSAITDRGPVGHARGVVTSIERTDAKESKRPVMANHYRYTAGGRAFSGTSYSTGDAVSTGAPVDVEYSPGDPARSKIAGMRRDTYSPAVAFLTLFPLGGIVVAALAMRRGAARTALLRDGILTGAKLESKQATNVTRNRNRVYLLTFTFTARDGRKYAVSARDTDTERLEDEIAEAVLYDPGNPDHAFVVDELPSRPKIDETGELRPRGGRAAAALFLPVVVTLGNLLAAI